MAERWLAEGVACHPKPQQWGVCNKQPQWIKTPFEITSLSQNNWLFTCYAVIHTPLIVLKASEMILQLFFSSSDTRPHLLETFVSFFPEQSCYVSFSAIRAVLSELKSSSVSWNTFMVNAFSGWWHPLQTSQLLPHYLTFWCVQVCVCVLVCVEGGTFSGNQDVLQLSMLAATLSLLSNLMDQRSQSVST